MENVKSCSLAELENMEQETYQLLDIRSMEAFDHGHLKDALNIPANELIERKDELQTEKKIIVYCQSGVISTDHCFPGLDLMPAVWKAVMINGC